MKSTLHRIEWIDLLRILATWGVISIHGKSSYNLEIGTYRWFESGIMNGFVFCVPVFLMMSGYLCLQREVSLRKTIVSRVPRVILMKVFTVFLCIMVGIFEAFVRGESIRGWIHTTLGWGGSTSYLAVLAGCYLVSPFLWEIIEKKSLEEYFLILSIVFCFIVPPFIDLESVRNVVPSSILSVMDWIDFAQVYIPVGSVALFVWGHYLGRISDKISRRMAIIFLVSGFVGYEFSTYYSAFYPGKNILLTALNYGRYYGGYISPMIIFYSTSVFVFFMIVVGKMKPLSLKLSMLVAHMGRNSAIIFLIHEIVIRIIRPHIPVFWAKSFLFETIADVTLYFVISYGISLVLERTPVVKKIFGKW